jgi:hypothetical protein
MPQTSTCLDFSDELKGSFEPQSESSPHGIGGDSMRYPAASAPRQRTRNTDTEVDYWSDLTLSSPCEGVPDQSDCNAFEGISRWPSLTWELHEKALNTWTVEGSASLVRDGGRIRRDGILSFASASSRFCETVYTILARSPGMWYVDESGLKWAIRVDRTTCEHQSLPAWAISLGHDSELLDPTLRATLHAQQSGYGSGIRPAELHEPTDLDQFALQVRRRSRMGHINQALSLATLLVRVANRGGECVIPVAVTGRRSGSSFRSSQELIEPLAELARLELRRIDLVGFDGEGGVQRSSTAVSGFDVLAEDAIRVRISADLATVLHAFGND